MRRRNFIKISGAASLATIIPSTAFAPELNVIAFPQHGTNQVMLISLDK